MSSDDNEEICIANIDTTFHKYGLILNTNNQFNGAEQKMQKYKFYALRILVLVHIIRYIYFHLVAKNGKVPMSY